MARKAKAQSRAKGQPRTTARQAKDQKARYERCRRRRWGLVKKAREYSRLFNAQVYLLMKDQHNAQYFTSEDAWIRDPQDADAVQVIAPGRKLTTARRTRSEDQTEPEDEASVESDMESEMGPDTEPDDTEFEGVEPDDAQLADVADDSDRMSNDGSSTDVMANQSYWVDQTPAQVPSPKAFTAFPSPMPAPTYNSNGIDLGFLKHFCRALDALFIGSKHVSQPW